MTPRAIVQRACAAGLDAIALCDHNSARNAGALWTVCRDEGIACLCGLEITTCEELHALALFDTPDAAMGMCERVYNWMSPRSNQPELFGEQPVVDARDQVIDTEWRLLCAPIQLTAQEVAVRVRALGGLFLAAHIDRPFTSVSSQLGDLDGSEGFEALELTSHAERPIWRQRYPGFPLFCSSDAHELAAIGTAWSECDLAAFTVANLRAALAADAVHCVRGQASTP